MVLFPHFPEPVVLWVKTLRSGGVLHFIPRPKGAVEKVLLRGGMNSRHYGRHELIPHRAGHLALLIRFFNSP